MTETKRIGVLYSRGPHFRRLLKHLRNAYPGAEVTAYIPEGYPEAFLTGLVDSQQSTADLSSAGLLKAIRAERFDLFVVMFPSPKLRLFAGLSGARERCCFGPDGRFFPLRFQPVRMIAGAVWRRIRGYILWRRIRKSVYRHPIGKE